MKKLVVILMLFVAANMSFGGIYYWNPATGSSVFSLGTNWSTAPGSASDTLHVGGNTTTYPNSANLAKLTGAWGVYYGTGAATNDDALIVGQAGTGNMELDNGTNVAYFKSVIVGDKGYTGTMTITSGTISTDASVDTGYLTVGRNSTSGSTTPGTGYLYINGGTVNMDRITIGELTSGNTVAGIGHIVLQNDGVINLQCVKTAAAGLKVNNGDFKWTDNGSSTVTTGYLTVNTATLIFEIGADGSIGEDGKGINVINNGVAGGPGTALFSANALIDLSFLSTPIISQWITLVTAANGITLSDDTLLTQASINAGWTYQITGDAGGLQTLQVMIPEPATISLLVMGVMGLLVRRGK